MKLKDICQKIIVMHKWSDIALMQGEKMAQMLENQYRYIMRKQHNINNGK